MQVLVGQWVGLKSAEHRHTRPGPTDQGVEQRLRERTPRCRQPWIGEARTRHG
jgi:hypothetical protein